MANFVFDYDVMAKKKQLKMRVTDIFVDDVLVLYGAVVDHGACEALVNDFH